MNKPVVSEQTRLVLSELPGITIDGKSHEPKFRVLYRELRKAVLSGQLKSGTRLPSTRILARQLSISRNTVLNAFDQLIAEGYLETQTGAGTYVASKLPEHWSSAKPVNGKPITAIAPSIALSNYANTLENVSLRSDQGNQTFAVGVPDLKAFPHKIWNRISSQISPAGLPGLMGYDNPQGYTPLRESIADYVRTSRAVNCHSNQILITCGAQQALDICSRLLLNPQDTAAMEEPGYIGTRRALISTGANVELCPVDHQGLQLDFLDSLNSQPKLLYVTPAHQYPLGAMMPLERRLGLLNWATKNNCWLVEDDYDSEYHYQNRPIASLHSLATTEQVIYMGSFSKVLFPSLRLGYLVLPEPLVSIFTKARQEQSGLISAHSQAVTAEFMKQGHFSRHLRKMRLLYADKLDCLLTTCKQLEPWCTVHARGAGMHLALEFIPELSESEVSKELFVQGVLHSRLSSYFQGNEKMQGLVLGFANSSHQQIVDGVETIHQTIRKIHRR